MKKTQEFRSSLRIFQLLVFRDRGKESDAAIVTWQANGEEKPLPGGALQLDFSSMGPDNPLDD